MTGRNGVRLQGVTTLLRDVIGETYNDGVVRREELSCGHEKVTFVERDRPAKRRRCNRCALGEAVR